MYPYHKPDYCKDCGTELAHNELLLCSICKKTTVIEQCAWCKKILGKHKVESNGGVTHGICKECNKKYFGE